MTTAKPLWAVQGMIDGQPYWLDADGQPTDNWKQAQTFTSKPDAQQFCDRHVSATDQFKWAPEQLPPVAG
jgi:hypothetical protein